MEERRASVRAIVRVDRVASYGLRGQFGTSFRELGETDDGRVEVEIGAPSAGMIAERLAGWGGDAEVVAPDEVARRAGADRQRARRPLRLTGCEERPLGIGACAASGGDPRLGCLGAAAEAVEHLRPAAWA